MIPRPPRLALKIVIRQDRMPRSCMRVYIAHPADGGIDLVSASKWGGGLG